MLVKRGQFMVALVMAIITIAANLAGGAYVYGRMTEKLDHITVALSKIDMIPTRVGLLEQVDREFERRLNDLDRRVRDVEQRRKAD